MPAAQRRRQLLDVAADIIESGGPSALTVDAVVDKAGVHRPVLYRHFQNAEELLDAVIDEELHALHEITVGAVVGVGGLEPRLRAVFAVWLQHFAKSPVLSNIALTRPPDTSERAMQRVTHQRASMKFLTAEFVDAGLTKTDAQILAATLLQGLGGVVKLWRNKVINRADLIDRYVLIAVSATQAMRTVNTFSH